MKKEEIPYFAIGNDELATKKIAGKSVKCSNCKKKHLIEYGTIKGKESKLFGFVNCGKKSFLVTIEGKIL